MKWLPKMTTLILLWGALAGVTVYIEPAILKDILIQNSYLPYLLLMAITFWYTLAVLLKSMTRSLVFTFTVMAGVALSVAKVINIGLLIVLVLTLVIESWYIYGRHEKIKPANEHQDRGASI